MRMGTTKRKAMGLCMALGAGALSAQVPPAEQQIAAAVQAAPEDRRGGAQVLGYVAEIAQGGVGRLGVLRPGSNDLICLADKPNDEKFSVSCYHQSLEPFMRRGRELDAEGVSGDDRMKRRWLEADAGTLAMPKIPATLYVLTGTRFDPATGKVVDPYLRYVVYTPWATQESTGLPLSPPGPGGPWLMFPGTAGAHIMITPPKESAGAPEKVPAPAIAPVKESPPAPKDHTER